MQLNFPDNGDHVDDITSITVKTNTTRHLASLNDGLYSIVFDAIHCLNQTKGNPGFTCTFLWHALKYSPIAEWQAIPTIKICWWRCSVEKQSMAHQLQLLCWTTSSEVWPHHQMETCHQNLWCHWDCICSCEWYCHYPTQTWWDWFLSFHSWESHDSRFLKFVPFTICILRDDDKMVARWCQDNRWLTSTGVLFWFRNV